MAVYVNTVSTTTRSLSLLCPGVTDDDGKTPLDLAVEENETEVINYLQTPSPPKPGVCNMVWQLCVRNIQSMHTVYIAYVHCAFEVGIPFQ